MHALFLHTPDITDQPPQIKPLENDKAEWIVTNRSLAEYNLSREPRLQGLKHQLTISYECANQARSEISDNRETFGMCSYLSEYGFGDSFMCTDIVALI